MNRNIYYKVIHRMAYRLEAPFNVYVFGNSMEPCLRDREKVTVIPLAKIPQIVLGDIIVFFKFADHLTIHRVIDIQNNEKGEIFRTKGDNNDYEDQYFVNRDEIIGVVCFEKERRDGD